MAYGVLSPGFSNPARKAILNIAFTGWGESFFVNIKRVSSGRIKEPDNDRKCLTKAAAPTGRVPGDSANHTARVYAHPGGWDDQNGW